jgi:TolA-binding protein
MSDTSPDLSKLSGELYRQWEKGMAQWWDQVLESPAFLSGMGQSLSGQAQARANYEQAVDQTLEQLHIPSRKDFIRLTRVATMLEDKLLSLEDKILTLGDQLAAQERETLLARVESAEARIEAREQLAALQARLDALEGKAPAAAAEPAEQKGRARRGKEESA